MEDCYTYCSYNDCANSDECAKALVANLLCTIGDRTTVFADPNYCNAYIAKNKEG